MIAVCGELSGGGTGGVSAAAVATRAAGAGATVQVIGVVADDPDGDRRLLQFAAAGVGHVAVLRGPARSLEAADVDLALRYLADLRVVVTVGLGAAVVEAAVERAAWAGASVITVQRPGSGQGVEGRAFPDGAIALEAPLSDPDGTFAGLVAALAARLDEGATPADAWTKTTRELAVDPVAHRG